MDKNERQRLRDKLGSLAPSGVLSVMLSKDKVRAMLDTIDTLESENARMKAEIDMLLNLTGIDRAEIARRAREGKK